ncbi:methionyl-tRNA formyltransferase [Abyssogena phaseoliformis symbiont OG214]|uniref:methionyl-tRNA formyltransferase n=1 Tax=Abyssogena phaseoliformis symbiont TaxID=596095 RepID=UPI001915786C|nr:methionyl-tRNA formyltransferase [Abyssogena phaseoliformis symbiont]MBW5289959.1 Methionyl-tRNA formyltransferase [Candidatus Ruthia sp. Apha_13_S6]BBB22915.1 methionyl-tRNA formyltransferase [Abyssogena phaseoliformis symbiont OG214]
MHAKSTSFKVRIVFAGTPEFSVGVLEALINAKHDIVSVFCQPDRPKGRGRVLTACPVKIKALEHNLNVFQPENLKDEKIQQTLAELNANVMVVVAYGQILPTKILNIPKYGCLNIHGSLLPRWRGAAPIQRAILAGDKTTGIGIMQMNEGLDTGDILLEKTCPITLTDTAQSLHNKLAKLGSNAIIETLNNLDNLSSTVQSENNITYAKKLKKDEAWIDWTQSAIQINRQIRAFNPYPIAQTHASSNRFDTKVLRILSASVVMVGSNHNPGSIIKHNKETCIVATGDGALSLETLQLSGKKVLNIKDFSNAYNLTKLD